MSLKTSEEHKRKLSHGLSFAWQMGFFIVIPIGMFSFLGAWYDSYTGDGGHTFLAFGIFAGIILSVSEISRLLVPLLHKNNGKKHA